MLVIDYSGEDQDPGLEALTSSPLFTNLAAARANQIYLIDGTQTVGAAWARMGRFLDELETILLDPDLDTDIRLVSRSCSAARTHRPDEAAPRLYLRGSFRDEYGPTVRSLRRVRRRCATAADVLNGLQRCEASKSVCLSTRMKASWSRTFTAALIQRCRSADPSSASLTFPLGSESHRP